MRTTKKIFLASVLAVVALIPPLAFVFAQEFVPLAPLPFVSDARDPVAFFQGLFTLGIVVAAFLAVIMIAIGGFTYILTASRDGKQWGKNAIEQALIGLFIVLFAWLLLYVINPDILKFRLFNTNTPTPTPPANETPQTQNIYTLQRCNGPLNFPSTECKFENFASLEDCRKEMEDSIKKGTPEFFPITCRIIRGRF